MKISNSKQQLAKIISENGGWRNGEFAAQDGDGGIGGYEVKPEWDSLAKYWWREASGQWFFANKIKNHHQTVLSRAEYFHLYPALDADVWIEWDGWKCPVDGDAVVDIKTRDGEIEFDEAYFWNCSHEQGSCIRDRQIIAYRLHKTEQSGATDKLSSEAVSAAKIALMSDSIEELVRKPTIEQLAADHRNAKDFAERKQQEADDAKADADAMLKALELAGEALGLLVSPITANQESELAIEFKVGDEVECVESNIKRGKYNGMVGTVLEVDGSSTPYLVDFGGDAKIWCYEVKFIRRP